MKKSETTKPFTYRLRKPCTNQKLFRNLPHHSNYNRSSQRKLEGVARCTHLWNVIGHHIIFNIHIKPQHLVESNHHICTNERVQSTHTTMYLSFQLYTISFRLLTKNHIYMTLHIAVQTKNLTYHIWFKEMNQNPAPHPLTINIPLFNGRVLPVQNKHNSELGRIHS